MTDQALAMTGPIQAMHSTRILGASLDATLTLATGPLTWLNQYWQQLWVRGTPSTKNAEATDDIGMWIWWFCVLWFVFLMALMFAFVVKYRRKKGKIAERSAAHNTPLEIAWTVIPTLFLVYIFFAGFWTYFDKVMSPGTAVQMDVVAKKWNFRLYYPNGSETTTTTVIGSADIPVFYVPAETPIKLRMISEDVNHSFFVPDFRIKEDIMHNRYTTEWFEAKAPSGGTVHPSSEAEVVAAKASAKSKGLLYHGPDYIKDLAGAPYEDHWVFCAEYCGEQHSEMAALLRVVPDAAYKAWLESIGPGSQPMNKLGPIVWKINGCSQCHSVDGSTNTGPTWKNMYGHAVEFNDGSSLTAEQMTDPISFGNYVHESLTCPACKIVKGFGPQMPVQTLKERQIQGVIAYLMSLSDVKPPPGAMPEDPPPAAAAPAAGAPAGAPAPSTPPEKK